ncbi:hypothetical protein [Flavilitoribacter nigricans]|uniref:Uncharacterized protein n=1 Tax=Flavilitoribacter nigricans (strain ATCC 23147 / DSM 23189 / NBRC 102662 / NCIMB 1420 / SS-2) TaxID=1122177 RepID=A0A2D0N6N4_FLAN2|nr:hypothetical protein [Flavilitoribacter nigricans]PHN03809.1 hypothetical protein CRP01_24995 [Flavilitoribacter nigricans DSM 23189 = NBRC 102662]
MTDSKPVNDRMASSREHYPERSVRFLLYTGVSFLALFGLIWWMPVDFATSSGLAFYLLLVLFAFLITLSCSLRGVYFGVFSLARKRLIVREVTVLLLNFGLLLYWMHTFIADLLPLIFPFQDLS